MHGRSVTYVRRTFEGYLKGSTAYLVVGGLSASGVTHTPLLHSLHDFAGRNARVAGTRPRRCPSILMELGGLFPRKHQTTEVLKVSADSSDAIGGGRQCLPSLQARVRTPASGQSRRIQRTRSCADQRSVRSITRLADGAQGRCHMPVSVLQGLHTSTLTWFSG